MDKWYLNLSLFGPFFLMVGPVRSALMKTTLLIFSEKSHIFYSIS